MTQDIHIGVPFKISEHEAIKRASEQADMKMGRFVRRLFMQSFNADVFQKVEKSKKKEFASRG